MPLNEKDREEGLRKLANIPENHYMCNMCEEYCEAPPYMIMYSYADPKIMEKIKFPPEYEKLKEEFREAWEKIPEGTALKPKITSKDWEYMLNVQRHTNYQTHCEICENCANELEQWMDDQYVRHKNK